MMDDCSSLMMISDDDILMMLMMDMIDSGGSQFTIRSAWILTV